MFNSFCVRFPGFGVPLGPGPELPLRPPWATLNPAPAWAIIPLMRHAVEATGRVHRRRKCADFLGGWAILPDSSLVVVGLGVHRAGSFSKAPSNACRASNESLGFGDADGRLRRDLAPRVGPGEGRFTTCAVTRRRFSSGCKPRPAIAPAGSNRGRHGGDEMSEALG